MFRTIATDNSTGRIVVQGARSQNTSNNIAELVFKNYDNDSHQTYDMANISIRDHFGDTTHNGYGDLLFSVNETERMRFTYDNKIGVNTDNPQCELDVNGWIAAKNVYLDHAFRTATFVPTIVDANDTAIAPYVYADAAPPLTDSNYSAWQFTNDAAGKKINWYLMANTSNTNPCFAAGLFKTFFVSIISRTSNLPFITAYTSKKNDGQDAASWYRARKNYLEPGSNAIGASNMILYIGQDPHVAGFANLDPSAIRVPLSFNSNLYNSYVGPSNTTDFAPTDVLQYIVLSTDSSMDVNKYDFSVLGGGYRIGSKIGRFVLYKE